MPYFSFTLLCFFLLQNQRTGGHNRFCPETGEGSDKGVPEIMYTYVSKCKNTYWNCSRNQGRGDEREQQRGWIQIWYIWYIVRTFANTPMCPHPAQYIIIKKKTLILLIGICC
jgi:hypothetical protein